MHVFLVTLQTCRKRGTAWWRTSKNRKTEQITTIRTIIKFNELYRIRYFNSYLRWYPSWVCNICVWCLYNPDICRQPPRPRQCQLTWDYSMYSAWPRLRMWMCRNVRAPTKSKVDVQQSAKTWVICRKSRLYVAKLYGVHSPHPQLRQEKYAIASCAPSTCAADMYVSMGSVRSCENRPDAHRCSVDCHGMKSHKMRNHLSHWWNRFSQTHSHTPKTNVPI